MSDNPFASYSCTIPSQYSEKVKTYSQSSGGQVTEMFAPFKRQIDFWYLSFLYAVKNSLDPVTETQSVNITQASIFSSDPYRISHIQLAHFGTFQDIDSLAEHKVVFDWAQQMANAGMPFILQILQDVDEPLMNLLDFLEQNS